VIKNSSILHSDALGINLQVIITTYSVTRIIQRPLSAVATVEVNEAIDSEWNITTGLFGLHIRWNYRNIISMILHLQKKTQKKPNHCKHIFSQIIQLIVTHLITIMINLIFI
jgi:hypothetical protein